MTTGVTLPWDDWLMVLVVGSLLDPRKKTALEGLTWQTVRPS